MKALSIPGRLAALRAPSQYSRMKMEIAGKLKRLEAEVLTLQAGPGISPLVWQEILFLPI